MISAEKPHSPRKPVKAPPTGLKKSGLALWRNVLRDYVLDPAEEVVLTELCRTVDRLEGLHVAARTVWHEPAASPGTGPGTCSSHFRRQTSKASGRPV